MLPLRRETGSTDSTVSNLMACWMTTCIPSVDGGCGFLGLDLVEWSGGLVGNLNVLNLSTPLVLI